jgi:sugar phosphate isomerase/epimerase
MDTTGIYYLCHGPREGDPNNIDTLENIYMPKLFKIFSIMPRLKMKLLTIHLWLDPRFLKKRTINHKIDMLGRLTENADEKGITISIENMSERAEDFFEIFDTLPSLFMTLDLGHAELLSEENTSYGFLNHFPERIKHLHIHDNNGGQSPSDDLHLPVGEGRINFEKIFSQLKRIRYKGTMTLELKPKEIERCIRYVRSLAG